MEDLKYYSAVLCCIYGSSCNSCPLIELNSKSCIDILQDETQQRLIKSKTIIQNEQQYEELLFFTLENNKIILNIANAFPFRTILEVLGLTASWCVSKYCIAKTSFYRALNTHHISKTQWNILNSIIMDNKEKLPEFDEIRLSEVDVYGKKII